MPWWNFCMSEDEKKEIEPIFTEKCEKYFWCASVAYNMAVSVLVPEDLIQFKNLWLKNLLILPVSNT